jgi:hypothetical protein
MLIAFLREFNRRNRQIGDPEYEEFQGLKRQVWQDLRHPRRWVARGEKRPVAAGDP